MSEKPKRERVLVVDDDPDIAEVLSRALADPEREVALATSGAAARDRLAWENFNLVITDVRMPGEMDGVDLFRWIKENRPKTDVVLISGSPDLESALESFRYGAWDYFVKPLDLLQLRQSIRRCFARRRAVVDAENPEQLRDALSLLAREINVLGSVRSTLGRYVSKDVADAVLGSSKSAAQTGERRRISVLFADIRNFTDYAESRQPEEVFAALNTLFELWVATVEKDGGIVDKFTGDGLMAVFNAPRKLRDHERCAVHCALEMEREAHAWEGPFEAGIGVNTGEAIVGNVGSSTRSGFTVIGSAVNLAARLEKRAKAGQVLLGSETAEAVRGDIETGLVSLMMIKGYSEAIPVFEALSLSRDTDAR